MHIKVISIFAGQPSAFANDINCFRRLPAIHVEVVFMRLDECFAEVIRNVMRCQNDGCRSL